jgi:SWI/SNF-related matrix-associated actin-dependent regulator of chromatin subfamily A protein 2/4
MALLAYLYESKENYGPHLIIVPNAVTINWKAELQTWLPDFKCIMYKGTREERATIFQRVRRALCVYVCGGGGGGACLPATTPQAPHHRPQLTRTLLLPRALRTTRPAAPFLTPQDVQSMQFNILVTSYEFIMRDKNKLSKLDWKYIIIDEAQRMKDRDSKLSQVRVAACGGVCVCVCVCVCAGRQARLEAQQLLVQHSRRMIRCAHHHTHLTTHRTRHRLQPGGHARRT